MLINEIDIARNLASKHLRDLDIDRVGVSNWESRPGMQLGALNHPAVGMLGQWMYRTEIVSIALFSARAWGCVYMFLESNPCGIVPVVDEETAAACYESSLDKTMPLPWRSMLMRHALLDTLSYRDNQIEVAPLDLAHISDQSVLPLPAPKEATAELFSAWVLRHGDSVEYPREEPHVVAPQG